MPEQGFSLLGLFVSAFVSATLAPGGSEAVLAYLANAGTFDNTVLLTVATVGNTLGALTTWILGMLMSVKCPLGENLSPQRQKALRAVEKWGRWALLFSWLPIVGDGLCFAGGWLRLPMVSSLLMVLTGKLFRYMGVIIATEHFL